MTEKTKRQATDSKMIRATTYLNKNLHAGHMKNSYKSVLRKQAKGKKVGEGPSRKKI